MQIVKTTRDHKRQRDHVYVQIEKPSDWEFFHEGAWRTWTSRKWGSQPSLVVHTVHPCVEPRHFARQKLTSIEDFKRVLIAWKLKTS